MTQLTQTVRRTADISRADALKGLVAKFPDHDIVSMRLETIESKTASGEVTSTQKQWVAEVVKAGFEESVAPVTDDPTQEEAPAEEPKDEDGPEVEVKVEGDEGGEEKPESTEDMLHEILGLIQELVEPAGEGAPLGEEGPVGPPEAMPGDPGLVDIPAPVKPHNGMENMQEGPRPAFAHMAGKRHFIVAADAPGQSLKSAVKELNAALAPTHRVAKIQRQGAKIVAGVTRVPGV